MDLELNMVNDEKDQLTDLLTERTNQLNLIQNDFELEKQQRSHLDREVELMREQLVKNADLLTSNTFSRDGSIRGKDFYFLGRMG